MSWARLKQTGIGIVDFRLEVVGWPYQFVSHPRLAWDMDDGRTRVCCLHRESIGSWGELIDPAKGQLDGKPPSFRFFEPGDGLYLQNVLAEPPVVLAELQDSITPTSVGVNIKNINNWTGTGKAHIGTEVIGVGFNPTTADGELGQILVSRGLWGTTAHSHFSIIHQAQNASLPAITSYPYVMEGRVMKLFVYGESDDPDGDGDQVWTGFVETEPRDVGDGMWDMPAQMTHEKLGQDMLAGAGKPVSIRGVHTSFSATIEHSTASGSGNDAIYFKGFWETQEDFAFDFTLALISVRQRGAYPSASIYRGIDVSFEYDTNALQTGTSMQADGISNLSLEIDDGTQTYTGGPLDGLEDQMRGRYFIKYTSTVGSAFVSFVSTTSPAEPYFTEAVGTGIYDDSAESFIGTMPQTTAAGTYRITPDIGKDALTTRCAYSGTVPRRSRGGGLIGWDIDALLSLPEVYLDNLPTVDPSSGILAIRYENADGTTSDRTPDAYNIDNGSITVPVFGKDATFSEHLDNSVAVSGPYELIPVFGFPTLGSASEPDSITPGAFFSRLIDESKLVSADVIPPLYNGVLDDAEWIADAYTEDWSLRSYNYVEELTFWDFVSPIMVMHKRHPYYQADGKLGLRTLQTLSDTVQHTLDAGDIKGRPTFERSGVLGAVGVITVEQDFDPLSEKFIGRRVKIRNYRVLDAIGDRRRMDISWVPFSGTKANELADTVYGTNYTPTPRELTAYFEDYLDLYGLGAYTLQVEYPLTYWGVEVGDVVSFSSPNCPNPTASTPGATTVAALVIGRQPDFVRSLIRFTLITTFSAAVT